MFNPIYAIAGGGVVFFQTVFKGPDGTSLHPLQRAGLIPADSHAAWPIRPAGRVPGLTDAPPAAWTPGEATFPMVVPLSGSPRDPNFMVG